MIRFIIDSKGFVKRNGVRAYLSRESDLGVVDHPRMRFSKDDWSRFCVAYPEVDAEEIITQDTKFCWLHGGGCEFEVRSDNRIEVSVYAKEIPCVPLMVLIFPDPNVELEGIYSEFMRPTEAEIVVERLDKNTRLRRGMSQIKTLVGYIPDRALPYLEVDRGDLELMSGYGLIGLLEQVLDSESLEEMLPSKVSMKMRKFLGEVDKDDFRDWDD